ncbi:MAG: hypothetical protein PUF23_00625, partial [Ruminococcus sp.]
RPVKKGVPLGVTVTIAAICSAIAFSGAYVYAMHTFNSKVTDLNEKQRMFTKLYEVDSAVRENYKGSIDEETLRESLSSTYVKSVDNDNILYVPESDYNEDKYSKDYKSFKISDGSYVLIKKSSLKNN